MDKVLFLSAPLKERIWGGSYFKEVLNLRNRRFKSTKALILTRFKNY